MTKTLDKIRQLRADAFAAKREVEERIAETSRRINQVSRRGIVPFDEAFPAWQAAFESYADEGKRQLERSLEDFAKPHHIHPSSNSVPTQPVVHDAFRIRNNASGIPIDVGAVFAHLNRESIIEQARAWFESKCAECNVPPADEREAELDRLASELKALQEELADIEDELADLFNTDPSERTRREQRRSERERQLDSFNGPIRERNAQMPEPKESRVTIERGSEDAA
jgi:DNA repair exonuclease SbcCD ATPase subunit